MSKWEYVIRDPKVFKQIFIKDFDYFEDHPSILPDVDELFNNTLFMMCGEKWRQMRATLSPAFTGSKMRQMFELISECADDIVKHCSEKAKSADRIDVEMKDFFSRYANDVIATCAFGIKVNSFLHTDNEFYLNGKKLFHFDGFRKVLVLMLTLMPNIAKSLRLRIFDYTASTLFKNMILDTMKIRQKNNIFRPDMINILMEARKGNLKHDLENETDVIHDGFATVEESHVGKANVSRMWNDNEVVAQCFAFFLAGLESISITLTFIAYELVANPDVQQKLYDEIDNTNKKIGGKRITYEALQQMKYLDQVVSETLRIWGGAAPNDRICVKDYVYDDGNMKFTIEKGSVVMVPAFGLHHDPKYFPNPDKFDPERFNEENKQNIASGTYIPFGLGPRNCIGELL